jgi:hypothetical protein
MAEFTGQDEEDILEETMDRGVNCGNAEKNGHGRDVSAPANYNPGSDCLWIRLQHKLFRLWEDHILPLQIGLNSPYL